MRKRLLIGATAAVVIGVAAYFLSQRKEGTVEWHKGEYLRINKRRSSVLWVDRSSVPRTVRSSYRRRLNGQSDFHERELIEAGYLSQSVFAVSNSSASDVWRAASSDLLGVLPQDVWRFTTIQGNPRELWIIAPREWSDTIGVAIRKADVPLTK